MADFIYFKDDELIRTLIWEGGRVRPVTTETGSMSMVLIRFKNLDRSELALEAVETRMAGLLEKFPDLEQSRIRITLTMDNSPTQAGPDLFRVKFHSSHGRYRDITVEKADASLYVALAEVFGHMLETLNRYGDRARVIERNRARSLSRPAPN